MNNDVQVSTNFVQANGLLVLQRGERKCLEQIRWFPAPASNYSPLVLLLLLLLLIMLLLLLSSVLLLLLLLLIKLLLLLSSVLLLLLQLLIMLLPILSSVLLLMLLLILYIVLRLPASTHTCSGACYRASAPGPNHIPETVCVVVGNVSVA